jgi:hypothetical protein
MLLPGIPDLVALRELTVSPFLRSQVQASGVGGLHIVLNTVLAGFAAHGVQFAEK